MTANAQNVLTNDVAIAKIGGIFKNFLEGIGEVLKQNVDSKSYFQSPSKETVGKDKSTTSDTVDSSPVEKAVNENSAGEKNSVDVEEPVVKTNGEENQQKVARSISDLVQQVEKNKAVEHRKSNKSTHVAQTTEPKDESVKPVNG